MARIEGTDLAGTLSRFLNRHLADLADAGEPKPAKIDVKLVLESRAPCQVQIDTLRVDYRLAVNTWTDSLPARDGEKRVLRFPGDRLAGQSLTVALPGTATVHGATLKLVESQAQASLKAAGSQAGGATALASPMPGEKTGLHVGTDRWIAQAIQPEQALTASRVVLGLLPLVAGTELAVALQESWNGQPSGRDLAAGTLALGRPGRAVWAALALPAPLTLSTEAYWLMLKATEGQAVWLTQTSSKTATAWQRPDDKHPWTQVAAPANGQPLYQFFSPLGEPPQPAPQAQAAPVESTCRLTIGAQTVAPTSRNGDTLHYDLAGALNAYLAGKPSPAGKIVLAFSAVGIKQITVLPPQIEYSPAPAQSGETSPASG